LVFNGVRRYDCGVIGGNNMPAYTNVSSILLDVVTCY